jgi:hypothetical protein
MARLLTGAGHDVKLLALIDTFHPLISPRPMTLRARAARLREEKLAYIAEVMARPRERLRKQTSLRRIDDHRSRGHRSNARPPNSERSSGRASTGPKPPVKRPAVQRSNPAQNVTSEEVSSLARSSRRPLPGMAEGRRLRAFEVRVCSAAGNLRVPRRGSAPRQRRGQGIVGQWQLAALTT